MCLFLLGEFIADNFSVGDLGALWDFISVNEKNGSSLNVSYALEEATDIVGHDLSTFLFMGPFLRLWYSCTLTMSGQTTLFISPGCRSRLPVAGQ